MQKDNSSLFTALESSPLGLTNAEAQLRLSTYGANVLVEKKRTPLWVKFLAQFKDLMVIILIAAAGISLIAGERNDAIVIMIVVVLNAVIGFIQEFKTEKALEALKKMLSPHATVIREGKKMTINAVDLVPGDVLMLQEGDRICADARLVEANQLECAEAPLTGESLPVTKSGANADPENMEHLYRVSMGTEITHGSGKAIVLCTGMQTEFGKIAGLTTDTKKDISPLQKELFNIGIFVGKITLVLSAILVLVSIFWQGRPILESIIFAVAVAVAAVPEGLPATITIALAIGVQKMAKHNAIIKQLSSVETLGSTTVICSDKTGTLTKNEMTVTDVWTNMQLFTLTGVGYAPEGSVTAVDPSIKLPPQLLMLGRIAALCNNASISKHDDGTYHVIGDPTEGALDTAAMKLGTAITTAEKTYPRVYELSFDADRKRMTTIHLESGMTVAYVKGAPDLLLERCTKILIDNQEVPLTDTHRGNILQTNHAMAKRALRVLGMAYRSVEKKPEYTAEAVEQGLVFVGLMGMIDPPRPEVLDAIALTKQAGIRIFIVTGDYGPTAAAIAAQIGLVTPELLRVVTGEELDTLSDDALKTLVAKDMREQILFARVSPKHKMRVVSALKELQEVVAVTGDGVNDAPALKRADIGVAMGITGTDVSKEAANMILTDDSFASIVLAIKEGRRIYTNLRKFVHYIFSSNIGELVTIFAGIMMGLPAPLTAILILCINLGTDVLPALALGVDPEEPHTMQVPPRDPNARMLNRAFITRMFIIGTGIGLIVVSAYLWSLTQQGWQWGEALTEEDPRHERSATIAFALLVLIQFMNAFSSRSEVHSVFNRRILENKALVLSIAISGILLVASIHLPWLNTVLHTVPLSGREWMVVIAGSLLILFVDELRKLFISKRAPKNV